MVRITRNVRKSLHLTVEGDAEVLISKLLRAELTRDGTGPVVTIYNARGKGAMNVINCSGRQAKRGAFSERAAMFDGDVDWNDRSRKAARASGILTVVSEPCVEALLLASYGLKPPMTSRECKQHFAERFGGEAHAERIFKQYFTIEVFRAARDKVEQLDLLFKLMYA